MERTKSTFIDYVGVLVKWRKFIIIHCFIVCVLSAGISLVVPIWYRSSTTILPQAADEGAFGISSALSNLPFGSLGLGLGAINEETTRFIAIFDSRTVMESVAERFNLIERYREKNIEETVRTLRERTNVKVNEEGTITLSVKAKTRSFSTKTERENARLLAKEMADYFVQRLDEVNKNLKVERARNSRIFLEKRYRQNVEDLHTAEDQFKVFQEEYGTIALPEQTTATISAAAEIKAQLIMKEVELGVLRDYVGESHADVVRIENEMRELQKRYDDFLYGRRGSEAMGERDVRLKDVFLPMETVPDLGLQYARLFRAVYMQETIMEFMLPQYEQAKIQEAKDTPTVQILDPANRPERKLKPKRILLVLFSGIISFLFFCMAVYINVNLEYVRKHEANRYNTILQILNQLKPINWFR